MFERTHLTFYYLLRTRVPGVYGPSWNMTREEPDPVRRTVIPLALGLAAMLASVVAPGWVVGAVALLGPFVAGMLDPDEPVRAGLLTVALPVVGGLIRVRVDHSSALGTLAFAGVCAAAFALIASHLGAGAQRRLGATDAGPES